MSDEQTPGGAPGSAQPQAGPCPACGTDTTPGVGRCPQCGARLYGEDFAGLRRLNAELHRLHAQREQLMDRLRAPSRPPAPDPAERAPERAAAAAGTGREAAGGGPAGSAAPRPQAGPGPLALGELSAQRLLAAAGVALLAVAAVVFAAVTWEQLGAAARGVILLATTGVAGLAARTLADRGLQVTAEAVAVLSVLLALVTVHGGRALGLAGLEQVPMSAYLALTSLLLAAAGRALGAWSRTRAPGVCAALLLLVVGPAAADWVAGQGIWDGAGVWAGVLLVAAGGLELDRRRVPDELAARILWLGAAASWLVAVSASADAVGAADASVWVPALGLGLAAAATVWAASTRPAAAAAAALAVTVVATVALDVHLELVDPGSAAAVVGLAAVVVARGLPAPRRTGWLAGCLPVGLVAAGAVLGLGGALAEAMAEVVADPWTAASLPAAGGRELLAGSVLLGAAVAVGLETSGRPRAGMAVALGVAAAGVAAATVVLGLPAWLRVVVGLLLAASPAVLGRGRPLPAALLVGSGAGAAWAVVWGLADPWLTVGALAAVSLGAAAWVAGDVAGRLDAVGCRGVGGMGLAAGLAVPMTAVAAAGGSAAASGVAGVVAAGLVLTVAGRTLDGGDLVVAEALAVTAALVGLALAGERPVWLAVAFATAGVAAALHASRPDRRPSVHVASLLLSASSWTLLADAEVEVVEAYTAPPALLTLAVGVWRLRSEPETGSLATLSVGLALALGPTAVQVLADPDDLVRVLALAAGGSALVALGAFLRLAAPVVYGSGAVAVVALTQLAVAASHLPRWVSFGTLGLLLIGGSATYERQRARLSAARDRLQRLR